MVKIKTQEEVLVMFLDSVKGIVAETEAKQKLLKEQGRTTDAIKLQSTVRLLQAWFATRGSLPF